VNIESIELFKYDGSVIVARSPVEKDVGLNTRSPE
jgi:hypothetical protein